MLVAPEINIHIKDDIRQITNSYVEFQYFDGNIIRIENNSFKLQSVASDFYIEIQDNIIMYGKLIPNTYDIINSLNVLVANKIIKTMQTENNCFVIMHPISKEEQSISA